MSFAGQVAMVTGAASGIGLATSQALADAGATVIMSDLDAAAVATHADPLGGSATGMGLDVTDGDAVADHVAEILSSHGRLDLAVNSAGIAHGLATLETTSLDTFDRVLAVNLRGTFLCLQAQINAMKGTGGGAIVNMGSAAGLAGAGRLAVYAASKHAVVGMTKSVAEEVARHGIRVNAVCPAFTNTAMLEDLSADLVARYGAEAAQARLSSRIPMGRPALVGEVVQAVLWALDVRNSFMTGAAIPIDGGLTAL